MGLTNIFRVFFESEKTAGILLIFATLVSLGLANSPWQAQYVNFWATDWGGHSLAHWINDGLMTVFFLLIGLELEREVYEGELSHIKNAALPLMAALGGMLVPASLFLLLNYGTPAQNGAGIPMATDIAFALGILSLLGKRVPASLKLFLTALAVIDDLGAVIVIALFYAGNISTLHLFTALGIFGGLLMLNRLRVHNVVPYLIGGAVMWYFMLHSGVHATITGVLLAFAIPFAKGGIHSPSNILQHYLHLPVSFFILPVFALVNTCLAINSYVLQELVQPHSLGIIIGLAIGKPLGITLFAMLGVGFGWGVLPAELSWKNIAVVGFLGGIGFTMSIFIALSAYTDPYMVDSSKIATLVGSVVSGLMGYILLQITLRHQKMHM